MPPATSSMNAFCSLAVQITEDRIAARALRTGKPASVVDAAAGGATTRDFLDIMLDVRYTSGLLRCKPMHLSPFSSQEVDSAALSKGEVIDELMIMFAGATETTAVTTCWILYALAKDAAGAPTPACYEGLFEFDPASVVTRSPVDSRGRIAETPATLSVSAAAPAPWRRPLSEILASTPAGSGEEGGGPSRLWSALASEVQAVVGSLDPSAPLRYEHLEKLTLCDGLIKEYERTCL